MDKKLRAKLEAIFSRLADDSGCTEAEKNEAARKLNQLLEKNGLTMADIDEEHTELVAFSYTTLFEKRLLQQLHWKVTNDPESPYWQVRRRRVIKFELTMVQSIEMKRYYEYLRPKLKDELEKSYLAFINAYKIYGEGKATSKRQLDLSWIKDILNRAKMIDGMLPAPQLPEKV